MFLNKKMFLIGFILGGYTALIFFVAKKLMEDDFNEQLDAEYSKMKEQMKKRKEEKVKEEDYWVHKDEPEWVKRNHEAVKKLEEDICETEKQEESKSKKAYVFITDEKAWMTAEKKGYDSVSLWFNREDGLVMTEDGNIIEDETKILGMTSNEIRELDEDVIYIQNDMAKVVYEVLSDGSTYGGDYDGDD